MNYGWIYCFSNPAMPGLLKVGMIHNADERTPLDRAKELYKTGLPLPFEIEFAKKVSNPKQKETLIHTLLSQYTERPNPLREFFRVSPEEVKTFFDLMDGEMWVDTRVVEDEAVEEALEEADEANTIALSCRRDMRKYFTDRQRICHTIGVNKTWIGTYDYARNGIICDTIFYKSLSGFVNTHHKHNGTYANNGVSGWATAKCEVDGQWISVSKIQPLH
jgi:hypothetical protein